MVFHRRRCRRDVMPFRNNNNNIARRSSRRLFHCLPFRGLTFRGLTFRCLTFRGLTFRGLTLRLCFGQSLPGPLGLITLVH